jgi:hypothetical protein
MDRPDTHPLANMVSVRRSILLLLGLVALPACAQEALDAALVTDVQGQVVRTTPQGKKPLPAFVKLKRGDSLTLDKARLQVVYFANGRQETWQGSGRIDILDDGGKSAGLPAPEVKTLPNVIVRQIAHTPALDSQGRAGTLRLRSMPAHGELAKLEAGYRELRAQTPPDDLTPETYLLAGLSDLRELDRIDAVIADLRKSHPQDARVADLARLYRRAPAPDEAPPSY